jgi:hypothetical protein
MSDAKRKNIYQSEDIRSTEELTAAAEAYQGVFRCLLSQLKSVDVCCYGPSIKECPRLVEKISRYGDIRQLTDVLRASLVFPTPSSLCQNRLAEGITQWNAAHCGKSRATIVRQKNRFKSEGYADILLNLCLESSSCLVPYLIVELQLHDANVFVTKEGSLPEGCKIDTTVQAGSAQHMSYALTRCGGGTCSEEAGAYSAASRAMGCTRTGDNIYSGDICRCLGSVDFHVQSAHFVNEHGGRGPRARNRMK